MNPTPPDAEKLDSDEIVSKKRNILMDMLNGILNSPREESSVDLWKLYIDGALDRLDNEVYGPLIATARQETINHVYKLSPTAQFKNWKPQDALRFYERLKAYEQELSHPAPVHKSDKE